MSFNTSERTPINITWASLNGQYREENAWRRFNQPGFMTEREAKKAAEGLLATDFLPRSLSAINVNIPADISFAKMLLLQIGQKCNVFLTTVSPDLAPASFVLMQPKTAGQLDQAVVDDYKNLTDLHTTLSREGLPLFVPKPYALGENDGLHGFSVEYLPNHDEVNPEDTPITSNETPYLTLVANSYSQQSVSYNHMLRWAISKIPGLEIPECNIAFSTLKPSHFYQVTERFKSELLARLYVVHKVMGRLPKEFSVAAGDFMADFHLQVEDFDPRLITIRGGWESVSENDFSSWVMDRQEPVFPWGEVGGQHKRLFTDQATVLWGIKKGEKLLKGKKIS